MPLYEYECQSCKNHFEEQQKLADKPLVTCPKCGKDELHKVISAAAFHLKGGGWYKDLYSSQKPGSSSEDNVSPKPTSSDSGKSDSGKPDSGKSDSGKSDSGKPDSGKSDSGKSESKSAPAAAAPASTPSASGSSGSGGSTT